MSTENKSQWLQVISTFWPMVVFLIGISAWTIKSQTISPTDFKNLKDGHNILKTRIAVVEEKMPEKNIMISIHENQAAMKTQLTQLSKNVDNIENFLRGKK